MCVNSAINFGASWTSTMMKIDFVNHNHAVFLDRLVVERYGRIDELQPPECFIISQLKQEFAGKRILDLGVGAGRTTPYLLDISENYIGIDFSPAMIATSQAKYPTISFAVGDARDLSRFPIASFDFVLFSHNGIDCLDHVGRLRALAEIRRVLAPSGVFIFSSRNRNSKVRKPWDVHRLKQKFHSLTRLHLLLIMLRFYTAGIYHYLEHWSQEEHTEEYVIGTDDIFNYDMLLYSISIDAQLAQLRQVGFGEMEVIGLNDPRVLRPDEYAGCNVPWLHYVCRSAACSAPSL